MDYRVKAKPIFWVWVVPACVLGPGMLVVDIAQGEWSDILHVMSSWMLAVMLPVSGLMMFFQRHRVYPPVSITNSGITLTNHAVEFVVAWQDIDRDRSVMTGRKWRIFRKSKPHFTPIVLVPSWYDDGLADDIVARMAAA